MKSARQLAVLLGVLWLSGGLMSASAQSDDANDRHVVVINHSSRIIREIYASNVDVTSWQEDILGRRVLPPGQMIRIDIDDGTGHCFYDLKAVSQDGTSVIRRRVNVCTTATWTLVDD